MRRISLLSAAVALAALVSGPVGHAETLGVGVPSPESAAWDPGTGRWYVSSQRGLAGGSIYVVDPASSVATSFVTGLDSPFGVDVHAGRLYAADQANLRVIDIATATVVLTVPLPGGSTNDIEVDRSTGDVYLGAGDQIIKVDLSGEAPVASVFATGISGINGLWIEGDTLYYVTLFGSPMLGGVYRMSLDAPSVRTQIAADVGVLDGIVRAGADFILTDFINGRILRLAPSGAITPIATVGPSGADLGIDPARNVIGVPSTGGGFVVFLSV